MLAFLQDGAVDGVSILKPETVRQMETRQFEFDPMLPGLGITFMEYLIDPVRIIAHGGDTVYFHSDMILVPDAHLGYFLSYNSLGKDVGGGRGEVWRSFVNRYFPRAGQPKVNVDPNMAKSDGRAVGGLYDGTRRGQTTLLRILALVGQFKVSSDKEGVLQIEGMKNQSGELQRWRRDRSAHLSRDGRLGKNWLSPRCVRRCRRNAPLPCDLRRTARSVVLQQDFYRFADWWEFAARVADRVALAGRGNDPQTISAPALQ